MTIAAVIILEILALGFHRTEALTNYYYYRGNQSRLKIRTDLVFVKTKTVLSRHELSFILSGYADAAPIEKYDPGEKMQFIHLKEGADVITVKKLIESLNNNPFIEYSSPVYSPESSNDGKVYAGLIDEILVQFKPGLSEKRIRDFIDSEGFTVKQKLELSGGKSYVLKLRDGKSALSIDEANRVYESGLADWSEPNLYMSGLLNLTPNDEYYPQQWAFRNTGKNIPGGVQGIAGSDSRLDSAWSITTGIPQCVICMVDTGIDTTHPDIKQNLVISKGYDFINDHPYPMDDNGHGTVTAGLVAAVQNNGIGISGTAPGCKLIAVKIFNSAANTTSSAMTNGIIYSYQQGWISSNSWCVSYNVTAVELAIIDAIEQGRSGKGTVFCFATGNNNSNLLWPASNPNVTSVGGHDPCNSRKSPESCDGETWWGANYGNGLIVTAPSVKVYSTSLNGGYFNAFSGTSVAAPICAGVCALALSLDSTQRWDSLRIRLCKTADKCGNYRYDGLGPYLNLGFTWNSEMGYGKINAYRLLKYVIDSYKPRILHTQLGNTENTDGQREVDCNIEPARSGLIPSLTRLYYKKNNVWSAAEFTNIGGKSWKANLPLTGPGEYKYYITATDSLNMSATSPNDAPMYCYSFYSGPDTSRPSIAHNYNSRIPKELWPYRIKAGVTDNIGIDSVWVKWYKNSGATGTKEFKMHVERENVYSGTFNSQVNDVSINDSVFYRIFAKDRSSNHNVDSSQVYKATIININRVCIGLGDGFTQGPFRTMYSDARTQIIYRSVDFPTSATTAGSIVGIGFNIISCTPQDFNSFTVKLRHTDLTSHTNWVNDGWTTVFSGLYSIDSTGWSYIYFTPPYFNYNRAHNLMVEICYDNDINNGSTTTVKSTNNLYIPLPVIAYKNGPYSGCMLQSTEIPGGRPDICFLIADMSNTGVELTSLIPDKYSLEQNFPNPFNPVTRIRYNVPITGMVHITVYDILGREILNPVNGVKQAGYYYVDFNASGLPSGVYFYAMTAEGFSDTKRMIVLK